MEKQIITSYIFPPIPYRGNDWVAYMEGEEEDGLKGWGETEEDAIIALMELFLYSMD